MAVGEGHTDLFTPVPFGTDQRGRPVTVLLMFANVLIGAMLRFGKTFAMRVLVLAAALDPLMELRVFALKGTGTCRQWKGAGGWWRTFTLSGDNGTQECGITT